MTTRPPKLLVRMVAVTFVAAAVLLAAIFCAVVVMSRNQVRKTVQQLLESSQRTVEALQQRERDHLQLQGTIAAESPTLKAAVDTYAAERRSTDPSIAAQLQRTIAGELTRISGRVDADAVVVVDAEGQTLAASGRRGVEWPIGARIPVIADRDGDGVVHTAHGPFRVVAAPLVVADDLIGMLYLASSLDDGFARRLSELSRTPTAIVSRGAVVASTLREATRAPFQQAVSQVAGGDDVVALAGEAYAVRRLFALDDTSIYALASIDDSAHAALREITTTLVLIGFGALSFALAGSVALAHFLSRPIGRLSGSICEIARSRDFQTRIARPGSSRELDTLAETFNALMASVAAAEAETKTAYTAAIRGLAAALDARDRYTAGHSERVSVLSIGIGRVMGLAPGALEVVRLGALLHDIGKIGVPDEILRKPGPLTPDEYETLQQHTVLGARILGTVPFLAPHIPMVELHHERPDGKGYPYGLRGDEIPLAARIVHVADAFDAMTTARAYRPERPAADALCELWACVGTEFDGEAVAALAESLAEPWRRAASFPETLSA